MAENSPASHQKQIGLSQPKTKTKMQSVRQQFRDAFIAKKTSKDEDHALYQKYERWAESIKITIQMFIGVILVLALLVQVIAFILNFFWENPFFQFFASHNPLYIIAFGLFFSTGVDLAYMLFTPGPDEAIDPVMTGLAAAILLGVGQLDFAQIKEEHGVALFLAAAALAGLFATKKYLFHPSDKNKNDTKNQTQLAKPE